MENDGYGSRGAGANLNTDDDVTITFLPLVDSERKLLHVHFLSAQEVSSPALPATARGDAVPPRSEGHRCIGTVVVTVAFWMLASCCAGCAAGTAQSEDGSPCPRAG